MVLTPKAQGLQLSTDGLRARLSQPPHGEDVALFLHTSGKHLLPHRTIGTESNHVALLTLCRHIKILHDDSNERLYCPCMPVCHSAFFTMHVHRWFAISRCKLWHPRLVTCAGTTSKPKGVPLTHANLAASLHNIAATYELTESDRSLLVMPLFHVHGLMAGNAALPPTQTESVQFHSSMQTLARGKACSM